MAGPGRGTPDTRRDGCGRGEPAEASAASTPEGMHAGFISRAGGGHRSVVDVISESSSSRRSSDAMKLAASAAAAAGKPEQRPSP